MQMLKKSVMACLAGLAILTACSDDKEGTARLQVKMVDAPAAYEAVNVDIQQVLVHTSETAGEQDKGWTELNSTNKGLYNLLELTGGVSALLAEGEFPAGKISQIRLVLGDDNSIVVDGEEMALNTPSAQQSGLKLNVHATLEEGITYELLLDFDAAHSIVAAGENKFNLKPVIRAITEAQSGAIKGIINPATADLVVFAKVGEESFSTYPDETGTFLIKGVPPGNYEVYFETSAPYQSKTLENVEVELGEVYDLGIVEIVQ